MNARLRVARMTDDELEQLDAKYEYLNDLLPAGEGLTDEELALWDAVNREIEAREDWNSDDDRIRESVGNYRSHR